MIWVDLMSIEFLFNCPRMQKGCSPNEGGGDGLVCVVEERSSRDGGDLTGEHD